jgi:glycosyltransferase involved in cell wall biosynthesis
MKLAEGRLDSVTEGHRLLWNGERGLASQSAIRASSCRIGGRDVSIAIVLAAFNEEMTVAATIMAFHHGLPGASLVVVDNNSSDATRSRAREALAAIGPNGVLLSEPRQGKGNAIRHAFHRVAADVYVLADADMTYPGDRVLDLVRPIVNDEADMVVGDRLAHGRYAAENKRRFHGFGNRLILSIVNRLFRARLGDIMSGFRAVSGSFVAGYPILVSGFQLETDMTLHALDKRFRVLEVPIEYRDRPTGSVSKLRTFSDGRQVLSTIIRLVRFFRPLLFFGVLAVILGLAGFIAAIPVMTDWISFGYIYHIPLAILATGLEIVALLCFGIGLILDSVVHLEQRAYERDLMGHRFG